jgi:hypothetical protein
MKKGIIPTFFLFVFSDLILILLGLTIYFRVSGFSHIVWVSCLGVLLAAIFSAFYFFIVEYNRPPLFIDHTFNIGVWADDILELNKSEVRNEFSFCIKFFIENFPNLLEASYARSVLETIVTPAVLQDALSGLKLEWKRRSVSFHGWGMYVTEKTGCYDNKFILLTWPGQVSKSDIFHMLGHLVDHLILDKNPDRHHFDTRWWSLLEILRDRAEAAWEKVLPRTSLSA